jgi:hypothetical protein
MTLALLRLLVRLGQPLPNLLFPIMIRRMRGQNLRRPLLARLLHAVPELHGCFGPIAALRHHHEPDVVGLGFVFAGCGHGEENVDDHAADVEGDVEEGEGHDTDEDYGGFGHAFAGLGVSFGGLVGKWWTDAV